MRNAPSVVFPVGRCRFYACVLIAVGALALAVLVAWCWPLMTRSPGGWLTDLPQVAGLLGGFSWLGWAVFAVTSWRHAPTGQLEWDALGGREETLDAQGVWRWRSTAYRDGTPLQEVGLALDLQSRVLLRLRNSDGAQSWVWAEQTREPGRWLDLRRALVATRA